MIVKQFKDHTKVDSKYCGQLRDILTDADHLELSIAIAVNIEKTEAHYHNDFEEIYFVLDGTILIELFEPKTDKKWTEQLSENELCVITKGIHHRIQDYSENNRLCIICVPPFNEKDEHLSDKI